MKKNVASQVIAAQLNALTDGAPVTSGTTTVYVTGDAGTQGAGGGTVAHEGNGCWSYVPTQAETNYDHIAFTFINSTAIPQTVNVYTTFPQTGDNFARLGAPAGASVSADVAAVKAETASIQSDTNDIQTRLPAALVSGRIDASVGAMASAVITATAIASDAITDAKVASDVTIASVTGAVGSVTGNVGGNVTGSVGSVASGGITRASFAADTGAQSVRSNTAQAGGATTITLDASASATDDFYNNDLIYLTGGTGVGQARFITDYVGSTKVATVATWTTNPDNTSTFAILPGDAIPGATAPTAAQVADAVWDEALAGHAGAGSTGEALAAAGSAGDPWITALPGSYSSGQAGHILGTYLDAAVSTRASQTSLNTLDDYVDTEIAAIISAIATVDTVVDAILVDTDVTIPGLIATVDTVVDAILVDTGTDIPASIDALPTAIENADAMLNRDMGAVSDTNSRSPLNALRFLRNKWSISGTTLTVTKENDVSSAWVATVSTDAAAEPVVGSDPS